MKKFFAALVISLALTSTSLFACTDFTGEFYSEEDGTYFSVFQIGCESVQYSYDNGDVFQRVTDGIEYVNSDVDTVDSDGNFEMNTKIFETSNFDGHKLKTSQRTVVTYSSGTIYTQAHKSETFLNKASDMVVIFHPEDAGKSVKTFKRALFSFNSKDCPNLTGSYVNPSKQTIKIEQKDCLEIAVESKDINQTLLLNNQYVVVQDDKDLEAQGRGAFSGDLLVLEVKVKYKTAPPIPRILLPVRAVNKYTQMSDGNLMEVSTIYNEMNGVLTSGKTLYKKQ